jgi:hypothetical protein
MAEKPSTLAQLRKQVPDAVRFYWQTRSKLAAIRAVQAEVVKLRCFFSEYSAWGNCLENEKIIYY